MNTTNENHQLTVDEEVYYANYGNIEYCDLCGNDGGIINRHDGKKYIEYNGVQFLCEKCRE